MSFKNSWEQFIARNIFKYFLHSNLLLLMSAKLKILVPVLGSVYTRNSAIKKVFFSPQAIKDFCDRPNG